MQTKQSTYGRFTGLLQVPQPGNIEPDEELPVFVIILIEHIIALRNNAAVVSCEHLEGVRTRRDLQSEADVRVRVIRGMRGDGLV